MKYSVLLGIFFLTTMGQGAFAGGSVETNICIKNTTSVRQRIYVADIKNYDWDGDSRPDHNFDGLAISPGETICKREEINGNSAYPEFTFLIDGAPSEMKYRSTVVTSGRNGKEYSDNQWGVTENINNPLCLPGEQTSYIQPRCLHGEKTIYFQPSDWRLGYKCNSGKKCSLFEIR